MSEKLVSIVLPVYNGERYLEQSIESVINQTYHNWELIIVNDCSTDSTEMIIEKYASAENRIRIQKNNTNKKLPRSLNIGFSLAKGEYFTWTSDDNCYRKDALASMVQYLDEHPECGLVYSDMEYINGDGQTIGSMKSCVKDMFRYNCVGACFMYRKECKQTLGEYDTERFLVEDYEYWLRIAKKYSIGHIDDELYQYRFHENSLSTTRMISVGEQLLRLKIDYIDFILEQLEVEDRYALLFELVIFDKNIAKKLAEKIVGSVGMQEVQWIFRERNFETEGSVLLFGAGVMGMNAFNYIGGENVYAFIDNNSQKQGTRIKEKEILPSDSLKQLHKKYDVVIATDVRKAYAIAKQLEEMKIYNYKVFYEVARG